MKRCYIRESLRVRREKWIESICDKRMAAKLMKDNPTPIKVLRTYKEKTHAYPS